MSRNTRSSSRRKKPNPAFYVGYVEDDETPEMIMKKFAQMERMQEAAKKAKREQNKLEEAKNENKKSSKAEMSDSDEEETEIEKNNGMLSEEQLVTLFNDTSYYSINSLKRNNEIMFQKQTVDEDGFVVGIDDPDYDKLMFEVDYDVTETEMLNWMDPEFCNHSFILFPQPIANKNINKLQKARMIILERMNFGKMMIKILNQQQQRKEPEEGVMVIKVSEQERDFQDFKVMELVQVH